MRSEFRSHRDGPAAQRCNAPTPPLFFLKDFQCVCLFFTRSLFSFSFEKKLTKDDTIYIYIGRTSSQYAHRQTHSPRSFYQKQSFAVGKKKKRANSTVVQILE